MTTGASVPVRDRAKRRARVLSALIAGGSFAACQTPDKSATKAAPEETCPALEAGVVHLATKRVEVDGQSHEAIAEVVGLGCGEETRRPDPKASPGSACTHHSVCTASRCECPSGRGAYLARACVDGRCAASSLACAVAPKAVDYDACRRADGG